jgi:lysozyme family protein
VIAVGHHLSGFGFDAHLHNGDPLTARTVHVPVGRPRTGQPPFSWEDSARDALELERVLDVQDWSIARILFELERANGFGYRRHQINTPYLWSCTSHYTKGRFVSDGHFDPQAVAEKCGAAALLKRLMDRQLVTLK